jgi:hypothetical protein
VPTPPEAEVRTAVTKAQRNGEIGCGSFTKKEAGVGGPRSVCSSVDLAS